MGIRFVDQDGIVRDMSELTDDQIDSIVSQLLERIPALSHIAIAVCAILEQQYRRKDDDNRPVLGAAPQPVESSDEH